MPEEQAFDAEPHQVQRENEQEKKQGVWILFPKLVPYKERTMTSRRPEKLDGFPLRAHHELPLWERIHAWCRYVQWYGPDRYNKDSPDSYFATERFVGRAEEYDPRREFGFPPVTEEQLRVVEEEMGEPHPPFLRNLYLHVANGGFGPGEGLTGIPGGFACMMQQDPRYQAHQKVNDFPPSAPPPVSSHPGSDLDGRFFSPGGRGNAFSVYGAAK